MVKRVKKSFFKSVFILGFRIRGEDSLRLMMIEQYTGLYKHLI